MNRRGVVAGIVILLGLGGTVFLFLNRSGEPDSADFSQWKPSPATLKQEVGPAKSDRRGEALRRDKFIRLFQNRFREHNPPRAVGIKFESDNMLFLKCEAGMSPWDRDKVATMLWNEARDAFGKSFEMDIFETYIGTRPIKIGELREDPKRPGTVNIAYKAPVIPNFTRRGPGRLDTPVTP